VPGDNTAVFPSFPLQPASAAEGTNRFHGSFPDPYLDYASTQMPRSMYDVLRWCEYIWLSWGTYRMACQRVVRYFLTRIELTDASDDEKEKFEDFLGPNHLSLMSELAISGDNRMAYGNDFLSIHVPFRRHLRCPKCSTEVPLENISYRWTSWHFESKCINPKCKYNGQFVRVDRRSIEQDKLKIIHWPPQQMRILNHPVTNESVYFWEIPPTIRALIERGNEFYLQKTPWEIIEACRQRKLFRFNKEVIFHSRDEPISGVRDYGWGIPLIMGNFKQAWLIQVLKRYNEAIALDYIIPFRTITPKPGTSREADPLLHMNLGNFQNKVLGMFRQHRRDPTMIHALPFAVEMQMLGAEGKELAPSDLIAAATDEFLNAQGVPAELYKGTLQIQAMPTALRLFERTWVSLIDGFNQEINWIFRRVSDLMNWENLKGRLQPTTMADDLERKAIMLQLAAGQQISRQTALAPFGVDLREEIKRMFEEEEYTQEQMARFQEEMAQKQQLQQTMQMGAAGQLPPGGGAAPAGGAPAQAGGPAPMGAPATAASAGGQELSVDDLSAQAEQEAYRMLSMPYEMRKSELLQIKRSNETLHALIIAKMETLRNQAKTQGGQMLLQQQAAGSAA
jgi:hypothetical protein